MFMALLQSEQKLNIGDKAPIFSLEGTDGDLYTVSDFEGKPVLIIFMCNHCPYVKAKFSRIKDITEKYKDKIVVIGINANDNPEYSDDSFENMKKVAEAENFNFIYLFDEGQEVSKTYGAVCTPDPFLFDSEHKLFYHGRLDDALSPEQEPKELDMEDAIERVLTGQEPDEEFKPSQGCSIKWVN